MLVPRSKGSRIAQSVETSNAESPTMMNIINYMQRYGISTFKGVYIIHPLERLRCFVFDLSMSLLSSSIVKIKAFSYAFLICIYSPSNIKHKAFSKVNMYKSNKIFNNE